jgi:energy-coupling factor transporter ATP-binding protein EcfA2
MKLARVSFLGVRGLADATYDFVAGGGAPHDLVVVTGPTASGKTRFLEAILATKEAIGPYGLPPSGASWVASGAFGAKVSLAFWLDEEERAYAGTSSAIMEADVTWSAQRGAADADDGLVAVLERYDHRPDRGKVEYFAATRRLPSHPPFHGTGPLEQRLLRGGRDARKYACVPRFLAELRANPAATRAFAARLEALSPTARYVRPATADGVPRCFTSRGGAPLTPMELSDGEADAVLFAATATTIALGRSVLLVDRPEIHADPSRLGALVAGLRALGPDNQLVLASASPELVAAARPAHVVTLEGA